MESFGARLKSAIKYAGTTQPELAEKIGVSQQSISRACKPSAKGTKKVLEIADVLKVNPIWLSHGVGEMRPLTPHNNDQQPLQAGDQFLLASGVSKINWNEITNTEARHNAPRIACPIPHSPNAFAVRFESDSMTSMHGPSYPKGCTLFVDAKKEGPISSGTKVIATIKDSSGQDLAVFKELKEEDGRQYLQALNTTSQIPHITNNFSIIGIVIGAWISE